MTDPLFDVGLEALVDYARGDKAGALRRVGRLAYDEFQRRRNTPPVIDGEYRVIEPTDVDTASRHDKAARLIREIDRASSFLITVLGQPRTGKTALCFKIAERRHKELARDLYCLGISQAALDTAGIGLWAHSFTQWSAIPDASDVLVDDADLPLASLDYRSADAKAFRELVEIRGHRNVGLLVNCHEGSGMNRYALSANVIFLKPSASFFPELDREGLKVFLKKADDVFKRLPPEEVKYRVLALARYPFPPFEDLLSYSFPDWYSDEFSRNKARE